MIVQPGTLAATAPPASNTKPSPSVPAAAQAVGTQDSPVLPGQNPQAVPVTLPSQPQDPRVVPFWEQDWGNVKRSSLVAAQKLEMPAQTPAGRSPSAHASPAELGYTDVVNVDFSETSIQGRVHKVQTTVRSAPTLGKYVIASNRKFPPPNLKNTGPTTRIKAAVPRSAAAGSQVPAGFTSALGPPVISRTNVLPLVS